ncbi:DUF2059 domain-containing protein [Sandaracinobacter sp. RS1-74]|uniref:DUF2059 domain-containing protein n=1 Tax=Sandaracinobacteroides sayramensis TaxID=2913411 RepID=UPI001EDA9530|nr:DUF2059 domain-containing protein [Sandaracinobacteroides sayramensis]MCG2841837.1 DUF2059 domain-containing protein [Sandaracinobacteroides sayramensis]
MLRTALLLGLLAAATPAAAQAPAPPAPQTADPEAAFNALPEAERTARLEAAGRMMASADMQAQIRKSLDSTVGYLMPVFMRGNEGKQGEVAAIVTEEFLAEANRMVPMLAEQVRRRHAEIFTAAELDQLTAFYSSPIGRKFTAVSPELQARLMRDGGPVGEAAARAALPRIIARLKAAHLNTPTRS